jgi:hypothetical protein
MGRPPKRTDYQIRGRGRTENGSEYARDATFVEDASRIRKNPDIATRLRPFAYNLLRAGPNENIKMPNGAPGSTSTSSSRSRAVLRRAILRTEQPWRLSAQELR